MGKIILEKNVEIAAAPEKVFAFLTSPSNLPLVLPGLNVSRLPELPLVESAQFDYSYPMAGTEINGVWTVVELKAPSLYMARTKGIGESEWRMEIIADASGCLFKLTIAYIVPEGLIRHAVAEALAAANEHAIEEMLAALKTIMERAG